MTTERQHTLVGCATCGTGDQPKYMVSVGDDWLCPQCAGAELAAARKENERYRGWLERQSRAYYDQFQNSDKADMSYSEGQYQMATRALHRFLALHSATEDADDRTT